MRVSIFFLREGRFTRLPMISGVAEDDGLLFYLSKYLTTNIPWFRQVLIFKILLGGWVTDYFVSV